MRTKKYVYLILAATFAFTCAFLATVMLRWGRPVDALPAFQERPITEPTATGRDLDAGMRTEIVFIVVGSHACAWCRRPEMVAHVARASTALADIAKDRLFEFTRIGVTVDGSPQTGFEYLKWLGEFDQVMTGGGWGNEMARHYGAARGVPQVVVTKRTIMRNKLGFVDAVKDEQLLTRKIGLFEISAWVQAGAPLPNVVVKNEKNEES